MLKMRVAGVPIEWEESPFEWVAPSRFGVARRYRRGPLKEMRVQVELEPVGGDRTLLTYRVQAWPRGLLGAVSVPIQIGVISRRSFGRIFEHYAEEARLSKAAAEEDRGFRIAPQLGVGEGLSDVAASRLRTLSARLGDLGHDRGLIERLTKLIEEGDEMELVRIRPYALADEWRADRRATLNLLLHAAREGM
ncbi:MAG: hypothetical protein EXR95_10015, partial [Gemmatimonadetes bacterium]|nr:hypothetical protein [Gemmatimonadota bacterium]